MKAEQREAEIKALHEDETTILPLLVNAILHANRICEKSLRTQAERVGLFTTHLRSEWISKIGRYKRSELTYYTFGLLTDTRFWIDAGIVARPKDHPMINALAEKALRMADQEQDDMKAQLRIMEAEVASSQSLMIRMKELVNASEQLATKAEKTMSPLAQ